MIRVEVEPTFEAFRVAARSLAERHVAPSEVAWEERAAGEQRVLFAQAAAAPETRPEEAAGTRPFDPGGNDARDTASTLRVPRQFVDLATYAVLHRGTGAPALLYEVLYRLTHGEARLLAIASDPLVIRVRRLAEEVRRDEHHMHAFVRFRRIETQDGEAYVAFHRPAHRILRLAAPFFARRFASLRWSIFTPDASAHWDGTDMRFEPGCARDPFEGAADQALDLFATYYAATFNPARTNLTLLRAQLPTRHWDTMPETRLVANLVADAVPRVSAMGARTVSASSAIVPASRELPILARAARACDACTLCGRATQTVFGEGSPHAPLMLVGEQPGDAEDQAGRPFVGPAGRVLDDALERAGVARGDLYVTNAVKHFKWEPRGKRRLHARPTYDEVVACRGWLDAELDAVRPRVVLCLGVTAAQSFLGRRFRLAHGKGRVFAAPGVDALLTTYHPSAVLRMDEASAPAALDTLVTDLRRAHELARQ